MKKETFDTQASLWNRLLGVEEKRSIDRALVKVLPPYGSRQSYLGSLLQ